MSMAIIIITTLYVVQIIISAFLFEKYLNAKTMMQIIKEDRDFYKSEMERFINHCEEDAILHRVEAAEWARDQRRRILVKKLQRLQREL